MLRASAIYRNFNLNRAAIKAALGSLGRNRKWQVAAANIICGTYFKYYKKDRNLVLVKRPHCHQPNSLSHWIQHPEIGPLPSDEADEREIVKYLGGMAEVLAPVSCAVPLPME